MAAIVMYVFVRRRKAQLGPRIVAFLRGRGPTGVDEIREHLGLGSLDVGDVRTVLASLQRDKLVIAVEPSPNESPGTKYRLPSE